MSINSILSDFIDLIKKNNYNDIKNIHFKKFYDFTVIYTDVLFDNLQHSNKVINYIIHNIDFIIINSEYNILKTYFKNIIIDRTNKTLLESNWTQCKIFYNYIGSYIYFFTYKNDNYFFMKYYIKKINDDSYIKSINPSIPIFNENGEINEQEEYILISHYHKHILSYSDDYILENKKYYKLDKNEIYFSCFDELDFESEKSIKIQEKLKKLINAGYCIKYNGLNYIYQNKLYHKINNLLEKNRNINLSYLDLYKSDNLNFIINYISLYPSDIIKRINISFKTIAKEYLNLYHLTRKKSHPEIYEQLDSDNRKILYELHNQFITTRNDELKSYDEFIDKKSLSVDIVYKYIKRLPIDILENIYLNRGEFIKKIKLAFNNDKFKIFFEDCINTKTISYLLSR
jgi:hypothetical protein